MTCTAALKISDNKKVDEKDEIYVVYFVKNWRRVTELLAFG